MMITKNMTRRILGAVAIAAIAVPALAQMAGGAGQRPMGAGGPGGAGGAGMAGGAGAGGGGMARTPANPDPSAVAAGTYELDATHSQVVATVPHMGFSRTMVYFKKLSGSFTWDPARPEASTLSVTVDPASLDSGNAERDDRLRGGMFFDTAQFPTITYAGTGLRKVDATHAVVSGNLTMKGVTKPVALEVTFNGGGQGMMRDTRAGFSATARFNRSDFGMNGFAPIVGDEINLLIEVEAAKK